MRHKLRQYTPRRLSGMLGGRAIARKGDSNMTSRNSEIADSYNSFLSTLLQIKKPLEDCTIQLFADLYLIRKNQQQYNNEKKRKISFSSADIFQDLLALYLSNMLSDDYSLFIEEKSGKLRPDILVRKNDKNHAIIEVKTSIGWNRGLIKNNLFKDRLRNLSKQFKVPQKRIIYVFESAGNVNSVFKQQVLSRKKNKYNNNIVALFNETADPKSIKNSDKSDIDQCFNELKENDLQQIIDIITSA